MMVIVISAVSSTGKTVMAQKLLEKYKIPYLSIDHLKMGLYKGYKECGFTPTDTNETIGEKLWPILKGIITTNIENGQHIIIEGCYILPHYLKDFDTAYSEKMIPVFFGFSKTYINQHVTSKIMKYRNAIEHRTGPEERTIAQLIKEHEDFKTKCLEAGVPYFEIERDYDKEIVEIYDYIEKHIRKIHDNGGNFFS